MAGMEHGAYSVKRLGTHEYCCSHMHVILLRQGVKVVTKKPRAHMCRPHNTLFKCRNSIISFREVLPFTYCMILLADMFGGADTSICTCSLPMTKARPTRRWSCIVSA